MSISFETLKYIYGIPTWIEGLDKDSTYEEIYQALLEKIGRASGIPPTYPDDSLCARIDELQKALEEIKNAYKFYEEGNEAFRNQNWTGFEAYDYYLKAAQRDIDTMKKLLDPATGAEKFFQDIESLKAKLNSGQISQSQFASQFQALLTKLESLTKQAEESINELQKVQVINENGLIDWDYSVDYDDQNLTMDMFDMRSDPETGELRPGSGRTGLRADIAFNKLSLLDKIKYLAIYYNCEDAAPITFPPDYSDVVYYKGQRLEVNRGFPTLPQEAGAKENGAMESFYVTFLIDRDSPINAFATFMETKVQALRKQVESLTKEVSFYNALMGGLNDALQKLNSQTYKPAQGDPEEGKVYSAIPEAVHAAAAYFLRHHTRKVTDANGNVYFLLQYDDEDQKGTSGVSGFYKGKYLLVPANSTNISNFIGQPEATIRALFGGNEGCAEYSESSTMTAASTDPTDPFYGVIKLDLSQTDEESKISYDALKREDGAKENPVKSFSVNDGSATKTFTISLMDSPAPYGYATPLQYFGYDQAGDGKFVGDKKQDGVWSNKDDVTADVVSQSWAAGFQNRVQAIETETQKINNDVMAQRSKIDTFDSTSSTLRKRASDTYLHAIGNIH